MTLEPDDNQATAGASARGPNDSAAGAGATGQLTRGFLFADLRGYTAFVEARGDSAAADLLDVYRGLVRDVVRRFGGAEIKTEGNSFYVVVPSASDAVRCGIAIVAAARRASVGQPDRPIQVCLRDTGPAGQPWIYWSFGSAHVLGVATAPGRPLPGALRLVAGARAVPEVIGC